MIAPTVTIAFYLMYRSRKIRSELYHNVAVCMWIMANSTWMMGEFMDKDLRGVAVVLFVIGLITLGVYYTLFFKKDRAAEKLLEE